MFKIHIPKCTSDLLSQNPQGRGPGICILETIKPTGVALHLDCERIGSVRAILKTSDILLMSLCKVVGQKSSGKFRTIMDVKRDEKD